MEFTTDKTLLERYFRQNPILHIYELGDLDPFFWSHTAWYAHCPQRHPTAVFLLYTGSPLPVLVAFDQTQDGSAQKLLAELQEHLPDRFYCHMSPWLREEWSSDFEVEFNGRYLRLGLQNWLDKDTSLPSHQLELKPQHQALAQEFYDRAYPDNWFDPRMLETGFYYAWMEQGQMIGIAGVHVVSEQYQVAALGNICTLPEARGKGIATALTQTVCAKLKSKKITVGLNVAEQNTAAIRVYEKLGFVQHAPYLELMISRK